MFASRGFLLVEAVKHGAVPVWVVAGGWSDVGSLTSDAIHAGWRLVREHSAVPGGLR